MTRQPPPSTLTHREDEILALLEGGSSTEDIAGGLFIALATVRNHIQSIMFKLGAHSRLEAVAINQGLVMARTAPRERTAGRILQWMTDHDIELNDTQLIELCRDFGDRKDRIPMQREDSSCPSSIPTRTT